MGVPSFYRWLVQKYPKVVSEVDDQKQGGVDNFYLDMNGIIHACFHPDDDISPPTTFTQVFNRMHDFIDHLFYIVKPRKLLYLAIDGVAPRAKMNQQRSRRFRSSKDAKIAEELEDKLRKQFENQGKTLLPKQESEVADSNIITPGTEFMHILSEDMQNYIESRMKENEAWENVKVILSDDKVPGEGEHKIMSFIRGQRSLPGYNPNTRHCLYGLDADLIMLALATHEIHFSILREEVLPTSYPSPPVVESIGKPELEMVVSENEPKWTPKRKQHYQFLNVWVLREYLALDLCGSPPKKEFDLERIIDDFIFMCFFAGNDFLPHIPSLEIHEGCLDLLMHIYKEEFESLGGYFVDIERVHEKKAAYIKLKRVEKFILAVGAYEEKIFNKRLDMKDRLLKRIIAEYNDAKMDEEVAFNEGRASDVVFSSSVNRLHSNDACLHTDDVDDVYKNTKELKLKLKDTLKKNSDLLKNGDVATDKVKFGKAGWKERYYTIKFNAQNPAEIETLRKSVALKYTEGLCWVLLYYFSEVPSWTWYYPYHYGPLASDFKGLSQTKLKFNKGLPFKPFDQLMGVLPPSSSGALPMGYKDLMTNSESCLCDFYPIDFETDLDGKRYLWQGISKLPFIQEDRLLSTTRQLESGLKDYEKHRNFTGVDKIFLKCSAETGRMEFESIGKVDGGMSKAELIIDGVKGAVLIPADFIDGAKSCVGDVMCLRYEAPRDVLHIPRVLEGVSFPDQVVNGDDIKETDLWHEYRGSSSNYMKRSSQYQRPMGDQSSNHDGAFVSDAIREGRGFTYGRGKSGSIPINPPQVPQFQPNYQGSRNDTIYSNYAPNYRPRVIENSGNMARLSISESSTQQHNVLQSGNTSHGKYVPKLRLAMENSGSMARHSTSSGNRYDRNAPTGFWTTHGRGAVLTNNLNRPSQPGRSWKEACLEVKQERSEQLNGAGQKNDGKEQGWYANKN